MLVPGFHEEVILLRGDRFPLPERDSDGAGTVIIGTLAKEGNGLRLLHLTLDGVVQAFVGLTESQLV